MPMPSRLTEHPEHDPPRWRVPLLTALTLLAFAGNSVLGRLALATTSIGPAAYTLLRLISGALMLAALVHWRRRYAGGVRQAGDWYGDRKSSRLNSSHHFSSRMPVSSCK